MSGQEGATVTGTVTSTFAATPNYAWTVQSGTVSVDGTLSLTFDETAFRLPDDSIEIRARLMSWESRADTAGVMTGTAAVQYSSDALSGDIPRTRCRATPWWKGVSRRTTSFGSAPGGGGRVGDPPVPVRAAASCCAGGQGR